MKILNNLRLKLKLLLIAIPPFLIVGTFSVIILLSLFNEKSNLLSTKNRILEAESLANLVHFLQIERGLSVGFIAGSGESNKDNILSIRSKVDSAISESREVLKYTDGDVSLLSSLNNINKTRKDIDSLVISIQDVKTYYSDVISLFLNIAITTIPSQMNDTQNRNAVQAYTHLASVKEALGQIRASLNAAFTNDKFIGNNYGVFSSSLGAYKINLDKFLILAPSNIAADYGKTFQGDAVDKTFEMINIAIKRKSEGGFNIIPAFWFETSTKSIDLLRDVELNLYIDTKNSIKNKIETISYKITMIISIILFLVIIGIIITILLTKNIVGSLTLFQNGLKSFFLYVNRQSDDVTQIKINSKDEFGEMAIVINENIEKTKKGIDEDRKLIDETISVLSEFEQGDLCQRLELNVSNPALMQLKAVLNNMASNLENNIDNVLKVLEEYAHHNYLNKIDEQGVKKHLLKLLNGVNTLGDSISTMLLSSLNDGKELQDESKNLKHVVELLSASTHEQAASLEETAAAMEEMTSNIRYNAQKADEMASVATQTDYSTKEQSELANKTKLAMAEIQNSTASIHRVVAAIENIAFQINILSLNAAVEAATAGDAGKGFAVVAQEVRNLANKSADAAKEIKTIVEQAVIKSNEGVDIANELTKGFETISQEIKQTSLLVQDVSNANREQMQGIDQINIAVTQLDQMTQENARIASEADRIANTTNYKAEAMVQDASSKEFVGKNKIIR